jgi:hypothetical protein
MDRRPGSESDTPGGKPKETRRARSPASPTFILNHSIASMIHIVPAVPPEVNGLADYCYQLWNHWPAPRTPWKCLAAQVTPRSHEAWPEAEISPFQLSRQGLLTALETAGPQTLVLHYVGYAYHSRGVPLWLPGALREWKKRNHGKVGLIVMFHETYAGRGSMKQSSYWLQPLARRLMISLAQMADHWVTSCPNYAEKIQTEAQTELSKGSVIPIGTSFPSVGHPQTKTWPLFQGGKLKIVLFGLPNTRLWALEAHENLLRLLCQHDLIERITLLGKPTTDPQTQAALDELHQRIGFQKPLTERFNPSPEEISQSLAEHDLGLLANYPSILSKSSVYALLCDHRVATVVRSEAGHGGDIAADTYPCFVNDDSQPQNCAAKLRDPSAVVTIQQRVEHAAEHVLNWSSITAKWQAVV